MDISSTVLDDYVVINNLEEFKIQLRVQQSFCNEVQTEMKQLQNRYMKKDKKYCRLKSENEQLHKRIIELERDLINNKTQFDLFQRFMVMTTVAATPSHTNISTRLPHTSSIQMIANTDTNPTIVPNTILSNRPKMGMNSVINELKLKFNTVKN